MSKCESHIGRHHPEDGRNWDCQCARCGSSMEFEECQNCGGEGVDGHECGEDTCCCLHPEDNVTCDICHGEGTFPTCLSGHVWCQTHPLPGRENASRGTVEWFTFDEKKEGE